MAAERPADAAASASGPRQRTIAVLDLGSNSFHMLIARARGGEALIVDKLREPVRLADGIQPDRTLSDEAQERALEVLSRYAQRIREFPEAAVRIVGTNTLRRARNGLAFRRRAAEVLGHTVEVISGEEEARLIYQGVAHSRSDPGVPRLIVDIGGGSTEVMTGVDFELTRGHSFYMGCVSYSRQHFSDGRITGKALSRAMTHALLELRAARRSLADHGCQLALGASGTCNAIAEILAANGWSTGAITREGLESLMAEMIERRSVEALDGLPGLRPDRVPVLAGGVAVLGALFEELQLESMDAVSGALREGILYDLIGRTENRDSREPSVMRLAQVYQVDAAQAEHVTTTAMRIADDVELLDGDDDFNPRAFLRWAAWLHEVGLSMSFAGFHRHGAYVVLNSHLPGFSRDDQTLLAALIRCHRRKIQGMAFDGLSGSHGAVALELIVIFRLAVLLNRSRSLPEIPRVRWNRKKQRIVIKFDTDWLERHPLSLADVEEEAEYLREFELDLRMKEFDS